MPYISKVADEPEKSKYVIGFARGLNTIQDRSLVDDKNLIEATNAMLVVDGVTRRYGSDKVWDEGGASYVYGSTAFYVRNGSSTTRELIRIANAQLQKLVGSSWTQIGATAYTNTQTTLLQARNRVYVHNGTDSMSYYDGSAIQTYTTLSTVGTPTVTPQGTTGSTTYSYIIAAFNSTGETAGSTAGTTATGNATLDSTNFNRITWTAVANAEGYNIYGRTATGYGEVFIATVYGQATASFDDTGSTNYPLVTSKLPQTFNNTGGLKGKIATYSRGRQWVAGVTEGSDYYPTRLYYSGTLNYVDTFVGGEFGGGWVEISSNDGGEIVDIQPFQNGVIAWKTNGVFKVYFTTSGIIAVDEVTTSHGGVSSRGSQVSDNDIIYVGQKDNKLEVYTVGQQENYVEGQLRTNNIGIFISDDLTGANRSLLNNIASFYYDNKYGFTYTTGGNTENDRGYILDVRFGSWVKWDSLPMKCTHYTVFDDGTDSLLYGGSNHDGYMIELFKSARNDYGSTFRTVVGTKFYNGGQFDVEKIFRNPTLWFKYIRSGSITAELWVDGTRKQGTANLSSSSGGAGAGSDLAGAFLAGSMAVASSDTTENADIPKELTGLFTGRSIGFYLIDENLNSNWLFMGLHLLWTPLEGKPLAQENRVELT